MGSIRSGVHPRGVHQARMPGVGQPLADTMQQLHATGDGAVGAADGGHNHVAQGGEGVVVNLYGVHIRRGALAEKAYADGLAGIGREVEEPPHHGVAGARTDDQRVGEVGRQQAGRGADAHGGYIVALHPQPQMLCPGGRNSDGRREHVLAVGAAGHQLRVGGIHAILVVAVHCEIEVSMRPAVDSPADVIGRRIVAVEVLTPREGGDRRALVHTQLGAARQGAVGVAGGDGQGVPSRRGINHAQRVVGHKVAEHGTMPAVAYGAQPLRE